MAPSTSDRSGSGELRRLFLEAALEILREPDIPLELRKVAERAGKSRTAPYLVFGKESEGGGVLALRIAVAAEGAREMADRMEAAAAGIDAPQAALENVALAFLTFVDGHRRLFRLMYGPDIDAVAGLGEDGFRAHPEFGALLDHRNRAGEVVSRIIRKAQERAELPADRPTPGRTSRGDEEPVSLRLLQIAWASMIGVAILRDDELLRSIGWRISLEQGARSVVEAVFGTDPQWAREVTASFLEAQEVEDVGPGILKVAQELVPLDLGLYVDDDVESFSTMRSAAPPPDWDIEPIAERSDEDGGVVERTISARSARGLPLFEGEAPRPPAKQLEIPLSEALAQHSGLHRATRSRTLLSHARILWIDDHPEWITKGVETLERLGARVQVARTTEAAKRLLKQEPSPDGPPFQVILSDIARGSRPDAGVRALPELASLAPGVPVIFFVAKLEEERGVPRGAAGITNRTDELLHLVLDALEGR